MDIRVVIFGVILQGGQPVSFIEKPATVDNHAIVREGYIVWEYLNDYYYHPPIYEPIPCVELRNDTPWEDSWLRYRTGVIDLSEFLNENYSHDRQIGIMFHIDGRPIWTNPRIICDSNNPDGYSSRWYRKIADAYYDYSWIFLVHDDPIVIELINGHEYYIQDIIHSWIFNPVDINMDGYTDNRDFIYYLKAYSSGSLIADFNGDWVVTVDDFLLYLETYCG